MEHPEPPKRPTPDQGPDTNQTDHEIVAQFQQTAQAIKAEIGRAVEGQTEVIDQLLVAFAAGGHVLLEGVPGVAKTLTVRCLAAALDLNFRRIQFTPDLMPADILGVNIYEAQKGAFVFKPGPIFSQFLMADEINRAPAKAQSALLEAMQERQVTIDGITYPLPKAFMVVATQNPLEHEGTYPLPEAQLDRFLMKIEMDYPEAQTERNMLTRMHGMGEVAAHAHDILNKRVSEAQVNAMRRLVYQTEIDQSVLDYIVALVRESRSFEALAVGAAPRAGFMLMQAAKAKALLNGRTFVRPDEVQDILKPVLRHRIILTPEAQIEGMTADGCLDTILQQVAVPR